MAESWRKMAGRCGISPFVQGGLFFADGDGGMPNLGDAPKGSGGPAFEPAVARVVATKAERQHQIDTADFREPACVHAIDDALSRSTVRAWAARRSDVAANADNAFAGLKVWVHKFDLVRSMACSADSRFSPYVRECRTRPASACARGDSAGQRIFDSGPAPRISSNGAW